MTVDPSVVTLLRENTRIELRNPKLSLSDANLSALLTGKTFELVPGDGEPRKVRCCAGRKALLHEPDVLTLTLTAPESYGIDAGQPLILHGVQVGGLSIVNSPAKASPLPSPSSLSIENW